MPGPHFKDVDAYIASFPKETQSVLTKLRQTVKKALPDAQEVISYNMPAYKVEGRGAVSFAAFQEHYSFFGSTEGVRKVFAKELRPYEVNDKGTIRFPLDKPVPVKLIRDLALYRAAEAKEWARKK